MAVTSTIKDSKRELKRMNDAQDFNVLNVELLEGRRVSAGKVLQGCVGLIQGHGEEEVDGLCLSADLPHKGLPLYTFGLSFSSLTSYLSISQRVQSDEAAKVSRAVWWREQREIEREGGNRRSGTAKGNSELTWILLNPSLFLLAFGRWWREVLSACTLDTAPSAEERRSAKVIRLPKPRTDVRRLKDCKAER